MIVCVGELCAGVVAGVGSKQKLKTLGSEEGGGNSRDRRGLPRPAATIGTQGVGVVWERSE